MDNRERDFTQSTIDDIQSQLQGSAEPFTEFQEFINQYGDLFETDLSSMLELDEYLTEYRDFLFNQAPAELERINTAVHELDTQTAASLRGHVEELHALGNTVDMFTDMLNSNFQTLPVRSSYMNLSTADVVNPSLWEQFLAILAQAGLLSLADGPLPFGECLAILYVLAGLGIITYQAIESFSNSGAADNELARTQGKYAAMTDSEIAEQHGIYMDKLKAAIAANDLSAITQYQLELDAINRVMEARKAKKSKDKDGKDVWNGNIDDDEVISNQGNKYNNKKAKKHGEADSHDKDLEHGEPNSSIDIKNKKGEVIRRRWYDSDGNAERDIDYTNHGHPKNHPEVPHEHKWPSSGRD